MNLRSAYDVPDIDPFYKVFLDHLREDGTSYVFEIANDPSFPSTFIKYEQCDQILRDRLRASEFGRVGHKIKTKKSDDERFCPRLARIACKSKKGSADESYAKFLEHMRVENGFMVLEISPDVFLRYEEVKGISIAGCGDRPAEDGWGKDENNEKELVPFEGSSGLDIAPMEECESNNRAAVSSVCSDLFQFKDKLLEVVSKPYDVDEYQKLLKEATERKPLNKQKHLRGMTKSYATNMPGLSYFDHHPDLAKEVESADGYRGLALLRGFFFWLKNLCHEGSFMPWKPPHRGMLPSTGYELMLPLDDTPINQIRVPCFDEALTHEFSEDDGDADDLLVLDG